MDCKVGPESFIDFHFGKITPAEREKVETHLAACPACLAEFFDLKRDLEEDASFKPSDLAKLRVRRDFAEYCASLISEEKKVWIYSNRVGIGVGFLTIAAALLLIVFSGQLAKTSRDQIPVETAPHGELRSLDEAVDSGRLSPGHINMI